MTQFVYDASTGNYYTIPRFKVKVSIDMLKDVKGVDYFQWTANSTRQNSIIINDDLDNFQVVYTSNYLQNSNTKLGKDVLTFDILARKTCPNCRNCVNCYAEKLEKLRPVVFNKHLLNTIALLNQTESVKQCIKEQLRKTKKSIVRIHSSGDFFAQWYVDFWVEIAREFPKIKFYGYSKTFHLFDFSKLNALPNANIVNSILPDGSINYGKVEYIREKSEQFAIKICPVNNDGIECMRNCTECLNCNYMLFEEH